MNAMLSTFHSLGPEMLQRTLEHVYLTFIAMGIETRKQELSLSRLFFIHYHFGIAWCCTSMIVDIAKHLRIPDQFAR